MNAKRSKPLKNIKSEQHRPPDHWLIAERNQDKITFRLHIDRSPDPPINFSANWVRVMNHERNEVKIAFGQINPLSRGLNRFYFIDIPSESIRDWFSSGKLLDNITQHIEKLGIDLDQDPYEAAETDQCYDKNNWVQDRASMAVAGYNGSEGEIRFYRVSPLVMQNKNPTFKVNGEPLVRMLMHIKLFAHLIRQLKASNSEDPEAVE
jgi:hypothetical protein